MRRAMMAGTLATGLLLTVAPIAAATPDELSTDDVTAYADAFVAAATSEDGTEPTDVACAPSAIPSKDAPSGVVCYGGRSGEIVVGRAPVTTDPAAAAFTVRVFVDPATLGAVGDVTTTVAATGSEPSATAGPLTFTVHAVEPHVDDFLEPEPGNRYLAVEVTLTNDGDETASFLSIGQAELVDAANRSWNTTFATSDRPTLDGDIPAGEARRGWLYFELPVDQTEVRLFVTAELFGGDAAQIPLTVPPG